MPPRVVVQLLVVVVLVPFLPRLLSCRSGWWEAWVYAILSVDGLTISWTLAALRHPDLLAERACMTRHEDAAEWDRLLSPLVGLGGGLVPLAAGLDARFAGSPSFGGLMHAVSLALILTGYALSSHALIKSRFFSGMVRIHADRGHHLVASGPYYCVRHPGYAEARLTFWATPLFLDATWAFVPAALPTVVLVIRTGLEDQTLQARLDGYREYAGRVRYRLLPDVWRKRGTSHRL